MYWLKIGLIYKVYNKKVEKVKNVKNKQKNTCKYINNTYLQK